MPPSAQTSPWPEALAGTPAAAVIERAISARRLAHSLLLHGDSLDTLVAAARAIASRLIAGAGPDPFSHPDCFALRPAGKSRQITADATRDLIAVMQLTATAAGPKVAVIYEADRMNTYAANIFLKTLEEPPANCTLLMLTTRPYALLTTIRSRCLHFKFAGASSSLASLPAEAETGTPPSALWQAWLSDYRAWIGRTSERSAAKAAVADHIFSIYGLLARFGAIIDRAVELDWEKRKLTLPAELEKDERIAIQAGVSVGFRVAMFADIENATMGAARARLGSGGDAARRAFTGAVSRLERNAGLMRANLNESAALEDFLLASLRLWAAR